MFGAIVFCHTINHSIHFCCGVTSSFPVNGHILPFERDEKTAFVTVLALSILSNIYIKTERP